MTTTERPMMLAGNDRYGPSLMIDDFRCAMPSVEIATQLAASGDMFDALENLVALTRGLIPSEGGSVAQAHAAAVAALAKAKGQW